jgi:outer membrane protein
VLRRLFFVALIAALTGHAAGQPQGDPLQDAFMQAGAHLRAGRLQDAEAVFRSMLRHTSGARVKLELARVLFLQGKYREARALFEEVSAASETPWQVRENVSGFLRQIDERAGYLRFGATIVSDSNPRNLAPQKEFAIGDLRLVPTEMPKRVTGLRYVVQGWKPRGGASESGAYLTASFTDYPGGDLDRLTVDAGLAGALPIPGHVRGKAGLEFGTYGGKPLYRFPYLGTEAVLSVSDAHRISGELKLGKAKFDDHGYLDATLGTGALSFRRAVSPTLLLTLGLGVERSSATERPYSYRDWSASPGISGFLPGSPVLVSAGVSRAVRDYEADDPLFGERRSDVRTRLEMTASNRQWRWRNKNLALIVSSERNRSNIGLYEYRRNMVSVLVE